MPSYLTFKTFKIQMPPTSAPHIPAPHMKVALFRHLSHSIACAMGFAILTFGLQAHATELPKTSNGLAQFAQAANKNSKAKPVAPPETSNVSPKGSPLNQPAQGVDAISSVLGTQPLRTPQIKPYQPPVKLTQSTPIPERTAAPLVTDPSRINLERAVEKAFAAEKQLELGGYKPVPDPMRNEPQAAPGQTTTQRPTAPKTSAQAQAPKAKQATQTYRVVAGDSLSSLSVRSGVSVADLAALNNLSVTSGLLRGQSLKFPQGALPAPATTPKTQVSSQASTAATAETQNLSDYRVVAGDGLIALSKRFDMSTADLAKLNNLSPTADLYVGQILKIPAATAVNPETYQVKRGDTLSGLAARFGLSVSELASFNDISASANLKVAQTLRLTEPSSSPIASTANNKTSSSTTNPSTYRVKSGDSLIQLARRFDLSTEALAEANGLSSRDQLKIGQTLTVPSLTEDYQVRRGDSLIALSKRYNISVEALAKINQISPTAMLQIGQTLQVPVS